MSLATNPTLQQAVPPPTAPDLEALKARQRTMWGSGDYAVIGATLPIVAEGLCESADVRAGERVLDVATGTGNAAIAAARRFAHVVGVDYVESLLERGRERAAAERLTVEFRTGDAEALPCADASFDVVLSTFGVMFAPDHARAARELARACRPGGRIALASWTPDGFIGEMLRVVGRHVPPPPAGAKPPALWGTEAHVRELFGGAARELRASRREFTFRYASARHFVDVFRRWYGPTVQAFKNLDAGAQEALARDLEALLARRHRGGGGLVVPGEYLEVVITRA
jgi:ubiquinone/menaquinone biosynthesis C-methylase UbiE